MRVTLMPSDFAPSPSPRRARARRPYFEFFQTPAHPPPHTAPPPPPPPPAPLGMPEKPMAPPVKLTVWLRSAVMASPKPSVTSEI